MHSVAYDENNKPYRPARVSVMEDNDMAEGNKKPRKFTPSEWKLDRIFAILKKIWMVVFTAAKVAIGALATVLLIGIVCGFVFVGILGDYLQDDVMPMASVVLEDYDLDTPSKFYYVNENGDIEVLQTVFAVTSWQEASIDEMPDAMLGCRPDYLLY